MNMITDLFGDDKPHLSGGGGVDFTVAPPAALPITIHSNEAVEHPRWMQALARAMAALTHGPDAATPLVPESLVPDSLVIVEGASGTGKTLLLERLLRDLRAAGRTATLVPRGDLGLDAEDASGELAAAGIARQPPVILIDEADKTDIATLEKLVEGGRNRIVVVRRDACAQASENRDGAGPVVIRLEALPEDEVGAFIEARLRGAGFAPGLLSDQAKSALGRLSSGIPRIVNMLASSALFLASSEESARVEARHVEEAAEFRGIGASAEPEIATPPSSDPSPAPADAALSDAMMAGEGERPEPQGDVLQTGADLLRAEDDVPPPAPSPSLTLLTAHEPLARASGATRPLRADPDAASGTIIFGGPRVVPATTKPAARTKVRLYLAAAVIVIAMILPAIRFLKLRTTDETPGSDKMATLTVPQPAPPPAAAIPEPARRQPAADIAQPVISKSPLAEAPSPSPAPEPPPPIVSTAPSPAVTTVNPPAVTSVSPSERKSERPAHDATAAAPRGGSQTQGSAPARESAPRRTSPDAQPLRQTAAPVAPGHAELDSLLSRYGGRDAREIPTTPPPTAAAKAPELTQAVSASPSSASPSSASARPTAMQPEESQPTSGQSNRAGSALGMAMRLSRSDLPTTDQGISGSTGATDPTSGYPAARTVERRDVGRGRDVGYYMMDSLGRRIFVATP